MNASEMPASKLSIWESREKSRESRTRKETRVRGARKKGPLPLTRLRRSLAHSLAKTPGGGVLPYMGYIGMCRCEGYGFQAVYSRIGCINQSVWV